VITRVRKLTDRREALYGTERDPTTRERLHTARQQLDATIEASPACPRCWTRLSPLKRPSAALRGRVT
jgi:uncharacterized protein with PIN domain